MARKKRNYRHRRSKKNPEHILPEGFWSQVLAVFLLALSILFIIAWLGAGGPILAWLVMVTSGAIGYSMYLLPLLFSYLAIEIFRSENARLPLVTWFASFLLIIWFSGLFGLIDSFQPKMSSGYFGIMINSVLLTLLNSAVAIFIYTILIFITLLFVLKLSPKTIFQAIKNFIGSGEDNDGLLSKNSKKTMFKMNAGVPTYDQDIAGSKKQSRLSSFKGSISQDKFAEGKSALVAVTDPNWKSPDLELLEKKESPANAGDVQQNARIIKDTLSEFSIDVVMEGANIGPKVTQYTLSPPSGVKLTKITALETNIALNLAAQSLRIEAPIPGQRAVGIEVPNKKFADVRLYGILTSKQWQSTNEPLDFAIGKDISGEAVVGELNKMPHLLIAGQTGSGKSVMINTLLTSLLYKNSPSDMKLILVDPKQVEMAPYADIPHLLTPVITEPEKTVSALKWAVNEMERRYKLLAEEKLRDITSYNLKAHSSSLNISVEDKNGNLQQHENGAMPYIVVVIDELADLMMIAARDVEALVVRLAQKARAVGIHLVLATQRPSVNVITGLIKANIPARIAFTVASQIDSRTILDQMGAEKLLGQGDMLLMVPGMSKPKRIQGAWVTDDEVNKITDHLRMQSAPQYNDEIVSQPVHLDGKGGVVMDMDGKSEDSMYQDAVRVVFEGRKASTSYLQRRLRIGYSRAARLIEEMEENGVIGAADGNRPREILISNLEETSPDIS